MKLTILWNSYYTVIILKFQIWSHLWPHIAYQNKSIPFSLTMSPIVTKFHLSSVSSLTCHPCPYISVIQTKSSVLIICSYVPENLWTSYFFHQSHSYPHHLLPADGIYSYHSSLAQSSFPLWSFPLIPSGRIAWVFSLPCPCIFKLTVLYCKSLCASPTYNTNIS